MDATVTPVFYRTSALWGRCPKKGRILHPVAEGWAGEEWQRKLPFCKGYQQTEGQTDAASSLVACPRQKKKTLKDN